MNSGFYTEILQAFDNPIRVYNLLDGFFCDSISFFISFVMSCYVQVLYFINRTGHELICLESKNLTVGFGYFIFVFMIKVL